MSESPKKGPLLVVFLTVFIDLLGFGVVIPLLPIYAQRFAIDESGIQLGLLMASFSAMQFVFAPIWGRLSDRYGRRPILMLGLAGSVVFYLLFALASLRSSLALLFVSRIGAGIFGATIPTAQAYVADVTTVETRSKGMALIGMAFGLGFTLGPLIGYLAVLAGQSEPGAIPGYFAAGLSLVALTLAWKILPEPTRSEGQSAHRSLLDVRMLRRALATPSIGLLLTGVFVCVFSFANFETTLSLLLKGHQRQGHTFDFSFGQVFLTFAYIGLVLALVQGVFMRRLAGRFSEGRLACTGAFLEVMGFLSITYCIQRNSTSLLFGALAIVVSGFALMSPSLNALISRRSDRQQQGEILGVNQSISSLARIFGSAIGIPLLKAHVMLPFFVAAGLMSLGLVLVAWAARSGSDFGGSSD